MVQSERFAILANLLIKASQDLLGVETSEIVEAQVVVGKRAVEQLSDRVSLLDFVPMDIIKVEDDVA